MSLPVSCHCVPTPPCQPMGGGIFRWPARSGAAKGVVVIPPLVGGTMAQPLSRSRWLLREGYDLVGFDFTGHGRRSGRFSLEAALADTTHAVAIAATWARDHHMPLYGLAACFSAIPLLDAAARLAEPFLGVVLVNPLPAVRLPKMAVAAGRHLYRRFQFRKPVVSARASVVDLMDRLFPGVARGWFQFGVLGRRHVRPLGLLAESLCFDPLARVTLARTPALCLASRVDPVLTAATGHSAKHLGRRLVRICPQTAFRWLDTDHYLTRPEGQAEARKAVLAFFKGGPGARSGDVHGPGDPRRVDAMV